MVSSSEKYSIIKMCSNNNNSVMVYVVVVLTVLVGTINARSSGLHSEQSAPPSRVQQCREGCLEKVKNYEKIKTILV